MSTDRDIEEGLELQIHNLREIDRLQKKMKRFNPFLDWCGRFLMMNAVIAIGCLWFGVAEVTTICAAIAMFIFTTNLPVFMYGYWVNRKIQKRIAQGYEGGGILKQLIQKKQKELEESEH